MISVVDDDASLREALVDLMSALGLTAEAFPDAEAFLNAPRHRSSDCLIADIQMPGMSGLELHRKLAADGRAVPTILITAYPDERTRQSALRAGVAKYLVKPFKNEELVASIQAILAERCIEESADDARKYVLLLHPIEPDRNYFKTVLEEQGYDVVVAYDREDLLRLARQRRPDLVLVHAMRLDALVLLKAEDALRDLPAVVIASYTPEYVAACLRESGIQAPTISVPIEADELAEAIARSMQATRPLR
jgi:FixJ family two-component response regulator